MKQILFIILFSLYCMPAGAQNVESLPETVKRLESRIGTIEKELKELKEIRSKTNTSNKKESTSDFCKAVYHIEEELEKTRMKVVVANFKIPGFQDCVYAPTSRNNVSMNCTTGLHYSSLYGKIRSDLNECYAGAPLLEERYPCKESNEKDVFGIKPPECFLKINRNDKFFNRIYLGFSRTPNSSSSFGIINLRFYKD